VHWHQDIEAEEPRFTTFAEGSELELDDLASMRKCKRSEGLTFRAELSTSGAERIELAKV
jgi:hypothetical protein